jgi:hypothetical protein
VQEVIQWVQGQFTSVPRLLVTGCSAGGAGAIINYHFIRQGLGDAVQCGYLLDDSGPIFPSSGNSGPLHTKVRESWNVDPIIDSLEGNFGGITGDDIKRDFGNLNSALANAYPNDRLSVTLFRRDLNYSLYSYESFNDFPEYTEIHRLGDEDVDLMRGIFDEKDNLAYYLPYWRIDNCSHCVSIPPIGLKGDEVANALAMPWLNTDIQAENVNLKQFVEMLLEDSRPLESFVEEDQASEGFTPEEAAECERL